MHQQKKGAALLRDPQNWSTSVLASPGSEPVQPAVGRAVATAPAAVSLCVTPGSEFYTNLSIEILDAMGVDAISCDRRCVSSR